MRRLALLFAFALFSRMALADDWMVRHKTAASFADTREAIVLAIENRGLVINFTSHIADMLERTGADIGGAKKIFEQAEIIEFCSAGLSRRMMEADPHNIALCPFARTTSCFAPSPFQSIPCRATRAAPGLPTASRRENRRRWSKAC